MTQETVKDRAQRVLDTLSRHTDPESFAQEIGLKSIGSIRTTVRRAAETLEVDPPRLPWVQLRTPQSQTDSSEKVDKLATIVKAMVAEIKDLKQRLESLESGATVPKTLTEGDFSNPTLRRFGVSSTQFRPATGYAHPDLTEEDLDLIPEELLTEDQRRDRDLQLLLDGPVTGIGSGYEN